MEKFNPDWLDNVGDAVDKVHDTAKKVHDTGKKAKDAAKKAENVTKQAEDVAKNSGNITKQAKDAAKKAENVTKQAKDAASKVNVKEGLHSLGDAAKKAENVKEGLHSLGDASDLNPFGGDSTNIVESAKNAFGDASDTIQDGMGSVGGVVRKAKNAVNSFDSFSNMINNATNIANMMGSSKDIQEYQNNILALIIFTMLITGTCCAYILVNGVSYILIMVSLLIQFAIVSTILISEKYWKKIKGIAVDILKIPGWHKLNMSTISLYTLLGTSYLLWPITTYLYISSLTPQLDNVVPTNINYEV